MKYIVLIPDGAADHPRDELAGKTPLEAAATPNFDYLAAGGKIGLVKTIPGGFPPGSDVANLCVLGYDPHLYYTGRAPLEAASLGIGLGPKDVAFRCNLVYVEGGVMRDFTAGHISTEEASSLIHFLQEKMGNKEISFFTGLSYRHIMISKGKALKATCTPPHDIIGCPINKYLPQGEGGHWLQEFMKTSAILLKDHPINQQRQNQGKLPANMIWLWGQGTAPRIPSLKARFGLEGAVIAAVDLVKGLGLYAGLEIIEVPGATGYLDTDYTAKARYGLDALERKDFVYIHVEAPDEASHMGNTEEKVIAIERFDRDLLGTLLEGLNLWPHHKILILPDHATPIDKKTHTSEHVPFLIYDSTKKSNLKQAFNEKAAKHSGFSIDQGWELMELFLQGKGR